MMEPQAGQTYTLNNQPGSILTVTRVWSEWNEVHHRSTEYVQYDIHHSDGRRPDLGCYSTRGNWDLGDYNRVYAGEKCLGIEIEPGAWSGCNAAETGATDCPRCGKHCPTPSELDQLREAVRVLGEECRDMREREPIGPSTNPGIIACRKATDANPIARAAVEGEE